MIRKIIEIVREAGEILLNAERSSEMVEDKAGHANFVTTYDKAIEAFLKDRLLKAVPEAFFMGEEGDTVEDISKGYVFICDPIDGTTNFIKDYHKSCVSVGLLLDGKPFIGVVYNPYLDEMFTAEKGKGAFVNGRQLHVSSAAFENALVIFGTAPYYDDIKKQSFEIAYDILLSCGDLRRSGSAALDLCDIAAGRGDIFFELKLSPWDYAAGAIIIAEAGGVISQMDGKELDFAKPCSVAAANNDRSRLEVIDRYINGTELKLC